MLRRSAAVAFVLLGLALPLKPARASQEPEVLSGEFMFPAGSKDVWRSALALAKELGFAFEKKDEKRQLFVTRWKDYDSRFPSADAVRLPAGSTPVRVQLHIAVSPRHEPARVAAGVVVDMEQQTAPTLSRTRVYRPEGLEQWLITRLAELAGVQPVPLAATPAGRIEQSTRLMPAGLEPVRDGTAERFGSKGRFHQAGEGRRSRARVSRLR